VAVGAVRAEVEADPRSATAWLKAGMTLEGGDLFSQARLCYRTAVELGAPPQAWYRWSVMAWKLGDQAEAIRTIGRALELAPAYAPSHWRLGTYLFDQGDFTAAAAAYQRATELDEGFVGAWAGLARLQLATDRPIDALALLEKLRRRFPEHTHLVVLTRTALIESGRREEAERLRVAWSALPPGNDPWQAELWPYLNKSLMDKARELLASGGAGEAVRLLEDWLAEGSGDRNARAYLAFGYHLLGRAVDARATLDSALEDDPDSVLVLSMQARIQELGGELAPALATCERVLAVDPSNGALQAQRGRILVRLGRSEEAARALRAALDLDGRGPDLWAEYGLALGTLGRWAEALAPLERAQRDGASTAGLAEALARARAESARTTEGR
jgi:tetratricopeptide (TPR) repeat protein